MASKGVFYGYEFSAFTFSGAGATEITAGANGPLSSSVVGETMTVDGAANFYAVEIDDDSDDDFLEDQFVEGGGDGGASDGTSDSQTIIAAGTTFPGLSDGNLVELEYEIVLSGSDGSTVTIYSLASAAGGENANDTILWLSNAEIDPSVTYTIVSSADGPEIPYSTLFVCFTKGTMIDTPSGPRAVEALSEGDLVNTKNHGPQPIRWISSRTIMTDANTAPVTITKGTLNAETDLTVSPQHRILVSGWRAELFFGEHEIFVPAKGLVNGDTIYQHSPGEVTYVHFMCDRHEIVFSNGVETESFHPGEESLSTLCERSKKELFTIFPELEENLSSYGQLARPALRVQDALTFRLH